MYSLGLCLQQRRFDFAALFPFLVHPFHPIGNPADAAFQKRDTQFGKTLGDAAVHQTGKLNESLHRPADRVHKNKTVETNFTRGTLAPVVHAERHVEALELFIERPKCLRSQMFLHALSSDRDRREP